MSRSPNSSSDAWSLRNKAPFLLPSLPPACELVDVDAESLRLRPPFCAGAFLAGASLGASGARACVGGGRSVGTGFCQRVSWPLLSM